MDKNTIKANNIKQYYKNKYNKEYYANKYNKEKRINYRRKGGIYKIYTNIICRIYKTFKKNNLIFKLKYEEILGCSIDELEIYLKLKFKNGMSFDNYGEWEVDHIIPVSSFDFTNEDNIIKCFYYTNLQPLWKAENRSKFNHIVSEAN